MAEIFWQQKIASTVTAKEYHILQLSILPTLSVCAFLTAKKVKMS